MVDVRRAACTKGKECSVGDMVCPICGEIIPKEKVQTASEEMRKHFEAKHKDLLKI